MQSSRPEHGRAGFRLRSKGWLDMWAAFLRPAPRSGWRFGTRSSCLLWRIVLFFGLVSWAVPRFIEAFDALGLVVSAPLRWLGRLGEWSGMWWPIGPILFFLVAIAWLRSGASARFQSPAWWWLRLFPWMRSILASYESANFAELLALLLEHQVPIPEALVLAASSTGNPRMIRGARGLAEAISRGETAPGAFEAVDRRAFLPMLRWVLATGQAQGSSSAP